MGKYVNDAHRYIDRYIVNTVYVIVCHDMLRTYIYVYVYDICMCMRISEVPTAPSQALVQIVQLLVPCRARRHKGEIAGEFGLYAPVISEINII